MMTIMFGLVAALDSGEKINAATAAHTKTNRVFIKRAEDAECWKQIQEPVGRKLTLIHPVNTVLFLSAIFE